jgi:hypothetical protein
VRLFAVMAVTGRLIWAPVVTMPGKARPFGVAASPSPAPRCDDMHCATTSLIGSKTFCRAAKELWGKLGDGMKKAA